MHETSWEPTLTSSWVFASLFIIIKIPPEELRELVVIKELLIFQRLTMLLILRLCIIWYFWLLDFWVAKGKALYCKSTAKKCGSKHYVIVKRTNKRLISVIHSLKLLNESVYVIQRVLDLIICITWREFELKHKSIKLVKNYDKSYILSNRFWD